MKIVVVDDDGDVRYLLRWIFEADGHEVFEAKDGAVALEQVAACGAELVVTDVRMPVMNGRDLIARLRADPATASIPIVVISGEDEVLLLADATVRKPFASADVLAAVRAAV